LQDLKDQVLEAIADQAAKLSTATPIIKRGQKPPGFPIDVIAGREEARLPIRCRTFAVPACERQPGDRYWRTLDRNDSGQGLLIS
jgi:hypothetical protein